MFKQPFTIAVLLSFAGAVPFLGLGAVVLLDPVASKTAIEVLISYGAVILSFLGAVHWGFALRDTAHPVNGTPLPPAVLGAERQLLIFGIVPALIGWACLRRLHLLMAGELVAGTHLVLDQKMAGYPGTAYVFLTLDGQDRKQLDAFESRAKLIPQVQECYLLAGQADYLLRVVYRDAGDLERLHSEVLTRLPGIRRVQSTMTLRTVKRTAMLPL